MNDPVPVTPAVVRWARERSGYNVEDLARQFAKLEEWEVGLSSPTYPQLERLADKLKLPVAVFFFPEPPEVPPILESFRTLPDIEVDALPPRIRYLLRKAKALQLNLAELSADATRLVTRDFAIGSSDKIAESAGSVREYLGISLDQQLGWADDDEAFKAWREALADAGVFVFKDAFRTPDYSGFCLFDAEYPVIYVNNTSAKTRQIFTLFHELGHLLHGTSGVDRVDWSFRRDAPASFGAANWAIERRCNRFAAKLLLPDDALVAALGGAEPKEDAAESLASRFHVSFEVVFRRFLDWKWIDQPRYEEAVNERRSAWERRRQDTDSGGNYYYNQISYLGSRYIDLALQQYHRNRIDEGKTAEYLNIKPKALASFEDWYYRGTG